MVNRYRASRSAARGPGSRQFFLKTLPSPGPAGGRSTDRGRGTDGRTSVRVGSKSSAVPPRRTAALLGDPRRRQLRLYRVRLRHLRLALRRADDRRSTDRGECIPDNNGELRSASPAAGTWRCSPTDACSIGTPSKAPTRAVQRHHRIRRRGRKRSDPPSHARPARRATSGPNRRRRTAALIPVARRTRRSSPISIPTTNTAPARSSAPTWCNSPMAASSPRGGTNYYSEPGYRSAAVRRHRARGSEEHPRVQSGRRSLGADRLDALRALVPDPRDARRRRRAVRRQRRHQAGRSRSSRISPLNSGRNVVQTETFDVGCGHWSENGPLGERTLPTYPRMHLLPNGERVLQRRRPGRSIPSGTATTWRCGTSSRDLRSGHARLEPTSPTPACRSSSIRSASIAWSRR